jgi:hypothetical protein
MRCARLKLLSFIAGSLACSPSLSLQQPSRSSCRTEQSFTCAKQAQDHAPWCSSMAGPVI